MNLWEGIKSAFLSAWNFVKELWLDFTIIGQIIQNWDSIREFFAGLWDSIVNLATGAVDRILAPFRAVKERVQELLPDFLTSGEGLFQAVGSGVAEGGRRLVDGVRGAFARVGDLLPHSDAKEGPFSTLTAAGRAIPETMAEGMRAGNGFPDAARSQFAQVNNVLQFPSGERVDVPAAGRQQDSGIAGVLRDLINRIGSGGTGNGKNERPIQVENLYVQFSESADLTRFVEELREQVEDVS